MQSHDKSEPSRQPTCRLAPLTRRSRGAGPADAHAPVGGQQRAAVVPARRAEAGVPLGQVLGGGLPQVEPPQPGARHLLHQLIQRPQLGRGHDD